MNFSLLFVLLSLFSAIPCPTRAQDGRGGRELSFPAYYFFADKRFVNHTIKRVTVKDLDECEYRCYLDANCVSLNIKNKDPTSGTHKCELNNSTHLEHGGYLEDNQLFYYRGAENKCGRNGWKCKNKSTCQSGFTHKGYRCSCTTGFKGEHCEKVDICKNYQTLADAERKYDYVTVNPKCDNTLNGWYRFQGAAGTKMVTTCPPKDRCDTNFPVWLSEDHPTVGEGAVKRKVCIHKFGNCCEHPGSIKVQNCGSYYIYYLKNLNQCNFRYCGTD